MVKVDVHYQVIYGVQNFTRPSTLIANQHDGYRRAEVLLNLTASYLLLGAALFGHRGTAAGALVGVVRSWYATVNVLYS